MKKGLLFLFALVGTLFSTAADITSTAAGGVWSAGTSWVGGTAPTSADNAIIVGTATITVSGSSISRNTGTTITIQTGGKLVNSNGITMNGTASMSVASGATYQHSMNGNSIPAGTWASGSLCLVTGIGGTAPGGLGQTFSNFTWNCTAQSSAVGLAGALTTINGDFTVTSTNSQQLRLASTQSNTLAVGGNLLINGGFLALNSGNGSEVLTVTGTTTISSGTLTTSTANNTGAPVINLNGNTTISGGSLDLQFSGSTAGANNGVLNFRGNVTISSGTLAKTGTATGASINFAKTGTQTYTKTGGTVSGNPSVNILSGAVVDFGTSVLDGISGAFNLAAGGGLITKNTAGITTSGATGAIQTTGTRTYSTGADYTYNGTAAQVMGNGFAGARNLTINNTSGASPAVTFIVNATISGDLTVTAGDVRNTSGTGRTITMTGAAPTLSVGGSITGTNVGAGNDLNLTYTNATGTLLISGAGSLCRFLNCTNTNTGSTIAVSRALEVMFGTFNENGILQINSGGSISGAGVAPTYGASSKLVYNSGTSYGNSTEWTGAGTTVGLGVPQDVTIQNNTTLTTTAARGIAGNMLVNAGSTLVIGGGTFSLAASKTATINGTFQLNSGGFASGGAGAVFSYAASGSGLTFNTAYGVSSGHIYYPSTNSPANVTVNSGTSTVDFGSITRTVTGTFTVSATISNYCNLTFNGTVALNSGYNFSGSCGAGLPAYACNSTLNYNSGGTPSRGGEWGSGTTPGGISISNNTTFNGNTGTATICGDLSIASGSSLYMDFGGSGASALNVGGNVSLAGNLSLGANAGGDMTVGGNWTRTGGSFTTNSRLVTFNGASGNQTITNASGETFSYLTVNKASGDVVLGGNVTVNNTLALTTGNLSIAANTLTLNGAFSRTSGSLAGGNSSNLTIGGTAGSLYFDNSSTNNYLKNFTLNTGTTATLANALNITGGASANNEGTLTVSGSGVLTTGGFLTIKSNSFGTARIAAGNTSGGYISGDVTVERFIPQNSSKAWRLLASNTTGQSINQAWQDGNIGDGVYTSTGFGTIITGRATTFGGSVPAAQAAGYDALAPGYALMKYDPATDNLYGIANTNSTGIASEQGYFIFIRGDRQSGSIDVGSPTAPTTSTVLRSKGTLFLGNQTAVPTGTSGYGLVRNPYPSRIDMRNIVRSGGLSNSFQVWDAKIGGGYGVGGYQTFTWDGVADYLVSPGGGGYGSNGDPYNFIESGAAFFIQGPAGQTAQVTEACKTTASSINSFRPATASEKMTFNLYAINPTSTDMVDGGLVFFNDIYSNAVDIEDVRKSPNFRENFGLIRDNVSLAVEKRMTVGEYDTVYFDMSNIRELDYRLDIKLTNIDPLITTAVLEDKYTNTNTSLDLTALNAYTFTVNASAASKAADRFRIVFRTATVVPVTFVSVKAAQQGGNIAVEWKVANQLNIVKYEVEKSADGSHFAKVGTVSASNSTTYNWMDQNAVRGYNYYRIKSVDNNGQVKYTEIVRVLVGNGKPAITVSPNPIQSNFVNIQFTEQQAGKYAIRLINISGQVVYSREVFHNGGNASQSFALSSLPAPGVYQLEITTPANLKHTEKLIVNPGN